MKALIMFGSGILFGSGICFGVLIAWMIVPNGKRLKEQSDSHQKKLEDLLQDKVDALWQINETLKDAQKV